MKPRFDVLMGRLVEDQTVKAGEGTAGSGLTISRKFEGGKSYYFGSVNSLSIAGLNNTDREVMITFTAGTTCALTYGVYFDVIGSVPTLTAGHRYTICIAEGKLAVGETTPGCYLVIEGGTGSEFGNFAYALTGSGTETAVIAFAPHVSQVPGGTAVSGKSIYGFGHAAVGSRFYASSVSGNFVFDGLNFVKCGETGNGAALNMQSSTAVVVTGCEFRGCSAGKHYVALFNGVPTVRVTDTMFAGNTAATNYPGIAINGAATIAEISGCTFAGNEAGAINTPVYIAGTCGTVAITDNIVYQAEMNLDYAGVLTTDCTSMVISGNTIRNQLGIYLGGSRGTFSVSGNVTDYGVLHLSGSTAIALTGGTFSGNRGTEAGVVYDMASATVTGSGISVSGNTANRGGFLHSFGSSGIAVISGSTFTGNTANIFGGVFYFANNNGANTIANCYFTGNAGCGGNVGATGGGCIFSNGAAVVITGSTFSGNSGSIGGSIRADETDSAINATGNIFSGNSAWYGGAIQIHGGTHALSGCTFTGNSAEEGGAVDQFYGQMSFTNCVFSGNTGSTGAGYAYLRNNDMTKDAVLTGCTFSGNTGTAIVTLAGVTVGNCVFSGNTDDVTGSGTVTIAGSTFGGKITLVEGVDAAGRGLVPGLVIGNAVFADAVQCAGPVNVESGAVLALSGTAGIGGTISVTGSATVTYDGTATVISGTGSTITGGGIA